MMKTQQAAASLATLQPTVAIIGYGTAGVNALIALRSAGFAGKVRIFSDTDILPYSPILTSYYAGGEKSYEECFPWSVEELDCLGAEVLYKEPVTRLDLKAHEIHTTRGSYGYTKCVIATGATPMCFTNTGSYKPLVLRTMDDAERLKAAITRSDCQRVLVSGASMVALKTLEACLERGCEVTLVGMNPHLLDFNALPDAAIRFEHGLKAKGVRLRLGQTITAVRVLDGSGEADGRQLEATFSTGEAEVFDEISVAHGVRGNLDFLAPEALAMGQALLVDDFMRTSDPDVYAAGDVAQATELISGEKRIVGVWKNAAVQGACAGRAIAAELAGAELPEEARYAGSISANTIAVQGTLFISAGTTETTGGRYVETREDDEMTVVYIYEGDEVAEDGGGNVASGGGAGGSQASGGAGGKRLVGFNLVCDKDEPGSLAYDTGAMLTLRITQAL